MGDVPEPRNESRSAREQRLAEALRANLKRRKAQQRGRQDVPPDASRQPAEKR